MTVSRSRVRAALAYLRARLGETSTRAAVVPVVVTALKPFVEIDAEWLDSVLTIAPPIIAAAMFLWPEKRGRG